LSTDIVPLSIEALKLRMEKHYRLAIRHQQKGADLERQWLAAMYPVEKIEPEVIEVDFGNNQK